ncbi:MULTISPECIES: hypothetical protein [unclassified Streptomyces]|uniref:hypothetical protein n=1 Tax=unclassified Streptomyces TaxID=2593676 RepID=UPI000374F5CE|nr:MULTISPECIES: hypothetical protein [unclassified Streptomyces]MYT30524.1 hypothetical protein [Streptomyces sp. SID8354]
MTTHSTVQTRQSVSTYPPGTVVHDVVANAVGRVADPKAYPPACSGRVCVLVVPLVGSTPAWQAEPGALRRAADEEIEAALAETMPAKAAAP